MADLARSHSQRVLPPSITDALHDARGEKIRHAAQALAEMLSEMHSVPCHVRIEDDFAFVLVMRDLEGIE